MRTITLNSLADVLSAVPQLLGFQPEDSLVMLNPGSFTARLDLPTNDTERDEANRNLVAPALRHGVTCTLLLAYGDLERGVPALMSMHNALTDVVVGVLERVIVTDGRYARVTPDGVVGEWTRIDPEHGEQFKPAPLPSRESLAMTFDHTGDAEVFAGAGVLLSSIVSDRDNLIGTLSRENAEADLGVFTRLVRTMPEDHPLRGEVISIAGLCAWLKGDGALAWHAVDRCEGTELHPVLTRVLTDAIHPDVWAGFKSSLAS